jgi:hypothetical protein
MKPEQSGPANEYRNQDRFGMAVAVALPKGTVVAPGPPRITAFEGESVRWKLLNTTKEPVTFELLFTERDPFEKGSYATSVAAGTSGELVRRIKAGAAVDKQATRYHYEIRVQDKPGTGIDPELDIYP